MGKLVEAFFYGLYMDPALLESTGFKPSDPRLARIEGYKLELNGVAKIVPSDGANVWGQLIKLSQADLEAMYSFETTKMYRPEKFTIILANGEEIEAGCYNAPADESAVFNDEYLGKLIKAAERLGLPGDYIQTLEKMY